MSEGFFHRSAGFGRFYLVGGCLLPHPGPLPRGEGEPSAARGKFADQALQEGTRTLFPLPAGEGQGEGECRHRQQSYASSLCRIPWKLRRPSGSLKAGLQAPSGLSPRCTRNSWVSRVVISARLWSALALRRFGLSNLQMIGRRLEFACCLFALSSLPLLSQPSNPASAPVKLRGTNK
jgi:hypothetical protein